MSMFTRVDEDILDFRELTGWGHLYRDDDGRVAFIAFGKHYVISLEKEERWAQEVARRRRAKHPEPRWSYRDLIEFWS